MGLQSPDVGRLVVVGGVGCHEEIDHLLSDRGSFSKAPFFLNRSDLVDELKMPLSSLRLLLQY